MILRITQWISVIVKLIKTFNDWSPPGSIMNRRTYLSTIGASAVAFTGCTALGKRSNTHMSDESTLEYYNQEDVVMNPDQLTILVQQESIQVGDQVQFKTSNTSDAAIHLGCHVPWALQRYSDNNWEHVAWTGERYFQLCATELNPGDSHVTTLTLSESKLEQRASDVQTPLRSGQYRFLLIGTSPYYGVEFEVRPAE